MSGLNLRARVSKHLNRQQVHSAMAFGEMAVKWGVVFAVASLSVVVGAYAFHGEQKMARRLKTDSAPRSNLDA